MILTAVLSVLILGSTLSLLGCGSEPDGLHHRSRPAYTSQDGGIVASIQLGGQRRIQRFFPDGSFKILTHNAGDAVDPSVSREGTHIAFVNITRKDTADIWIMDIDGGNARQLTAAQGYRAFPVVVRQRNSVIFARASMLRQTSTGGTRWVGWDIYEVPAQGGLEHRVTHASFWGIGSVDVSADGKTAVVDTDHLKRASGLEVIDLTSGAVSTIGMPEDRQGSIDTVSGRIAFVKDAGDYNYEIFVMQRDGSERRQLTNLKSYGWSPSFSKDGRRVVFLSDITRKGPFQLWEASVDAKEAKRVSLRYQ